MFHVERMKKAFFCILFLAFSTYTSGCKHEDPTPELSDKIFKDLQSELDIAKKNTEGEIAQQSTVAKELSQAVPQTGQRGIQQRRVFDSLNQLDVYHQQEKYFEVKLEERRIYVRKRYLESLLPKGRTWPAPEEDAEYALKLKLRRAKLDWDKKRVPRGTASAEKPKSGGHSETPGHGEAPESGHH